jgi:hypothetical protein
MKMAQNRGMKVAQNRGMKVAQNWGTKTAELGQGSQIHNYLHYRGTTKWEVHQEEDYT